MTNQIETRDRSETARATLDQINALDVWARARWGVKAALVDGAELQLNCGRKRILVTLDASDTYTVVVGRLTKSWDFKVSAERSGVYAAELVKTIDAVA